MSEVDIMSVRKLTILHANDLHGQLHFTLQEDCTLQGGISLTSGYVKKIRAQEEGVFFGICGDVLQEDILGSDYKGTNTVNILDYVRPDAISLGNHELDYGFAHLLTFKSCIDAPTLCANIRVGHLAKDLFLPSMVYETNGVRMLLIGVIPRAFLNKIMSDEFCRSMLDYKETYEAIRDEIQKHENERIDLVVLMSHYGIEGDRILAQEMPKDLRVDIILGGHSHINMDEAEVINDIVLAQSSYGTTHIGRFDLEVDTTNHCLVSWKWNRIHLTEETSSFDYGIDELADKIVFHKKKTSGTGKICEFAEKYTHKSRLFETDLGDIVADAFFETHHPDFVILQSGSLRLKEVETELTEKALRQLYPFDDKFLIVTMSGKEIREGFEYLFSLKPDGSVMNGTFQFSRGFRLEADFTDCWNRGCRIESLTLNGKPLEEKTLYRVGVTANCASGFIRYFSLSIPEERKQTVSLSSYYDLARWFLAQPDKVSVNGRGRFIIHNFEG